MRPVAPYLACSRPALELLSSLPAGKAYLDYAGLAGYSRLSRASNLRLANELVEAHLIARIRRDWYATATKSAQLLLLTEPNAYYRSLLLDDDVFATTGMKAWAFACVGIRRALPFEIPRAIPVLRFDALPTVGPEEPARRPGPRPTLYPEAMRFDFGPKDLTRENVAFPSTTETKEETIESRPVPCIRPATALAMLAATADPRIVPAVGEAAPRLQLSFDAVMAEARRLQPRNAHAKAKRHNAIVFPRWLQPVSGTAREVHAQKYMREAAGERLARRRRT